MADYLATPLRKKAKVSFSSTISFTQYVGLFKDDTTQAFGNKDTGEIVARLDYHSSLNDASYGDHIATLKLLHSPEWRAWTGIDGKAISQVQFAEFLEQHELDVIEPASAEVMEAVLELQAKRSVSFKRAIDLTSGRTQLLYEDVEEGKGKGEIKLPKELTLGLSVYDFSAPVQIIVKLRYRISDEGKLSFIVSLIRPHKAVDEAFGLVVAQIEADTGLSVLYGTAVMG
jgi:uncharacterized protein YfdQ (DUF2303 family)